MAGLEPTTPGLIAGLYEDFSADTPQPYLAGASNLLSYILHSMVLHHFL